jgi:uncharacterized metal-binding protein
MNRSAGDTRKLRCASCGGYECRSGADCFGLREGIDSLYADERTAALHRAATAIEGRHYCKEPRLGELILFAEEMGFTELGLVFCVGLRTEAETIARILGRHFTVSSVCCKVGGIEKRRFGLERIDEDREGEVMCNPAGAAELLNRAGTELNVVCGLCVGHDALFAARSAAPVTTLIVKDRVLAHNPAGAVYCPYVRRKYLPDETGKR